MKEGQKHEKGGKNPFRAEMLKLASTGQFHPFIYNLFCWGCIVFSWAQYMSEKKYIIGYMK